MAFLAQHCGSDFEGWIMNRSNAAERSGTRSCSPNSPASPAALLTTKLLRSLKPLRSCASVEGEAGADRNESSASILRSNACLLKCDCTRRSKRLGYDESYALVRLPAFYPILDTETAVRHGISLVAAAGEILDAGARILQFRHKGFFSRQVFAEAEQVAALCRQAGALFVMNDRADLARLMGAAVHLGQDDL